MSRAYGGKLGVWLTKKNIPSSSNTRSLDSSSSPPAPPQSQSSQYQRQQLELQHQEEEQQQQEAFKARTKRNVYSNHMGRSRSCHRAKKVILAGGSFLPSTIMNRLHQVQSKWSSAVSRGGDCYSSKQMIGWDDVQCRPVYYNTTPQQKQQQQRKVLNSNKTDDTTSDTISGSSSSSSEHDSLPSPLPPGIFSSFNNHEHEHPHDHYDFDDGFQQEQPQNAFLVDKKLNNKPKHSYGNLTNNHRRKRRLVDMATSVWEHCVSPARKLYPIQYGTTTTNGGTEKQMRRRRRRHFVTTTLSSSLSSVLLAKDEVVVAGTNCTLIGLMKKVEDETPPPPNNAVVCFDSNHRQQGEEENNNDNNNQNNDEIMLSEKKKDLNLPTFDDLNSQELMPEIRLKPKTCKIRVKEREDSALVCVDGSSETFLQEGRHDCVVVGHQDEKDRQTRPCQPTSLTALAEAKAFFDYLDTTHELKIE